ncbi:MAG: hypothetical protein FD146_108 [Anaerolineaceae bacterium]|nr:MAG: hypothetical protein FD146_108 [Anaerolineaceae bacterium]
MLDTKLQTLPVSLILQDVQDEHLEICRLLAAATVSPSFCRLLLEDPERAIQTGYREESFLLTAEERNLVLSIGADSLESLAWHISQTLGQRTHPFVTHAAEASELFGH